MSYVTVNNNTVRGLSPSAFKLFCESKDDGADYFIRYFVKPRKDPQENYMAAGSAFDAYVKSYIINTVYKQNDPKFELRTLFEAQVEPHNREEAWEVGKLLFSQYMQYGALEALLIDLRQSSIPPRFELDVKGSIDGIPLTGKPDGIFVTPSGVPVILDWKVNGFYSASPKSPAKGYIRCYNSDLSVTSHPKLTPHDVGGTMVNSRFSMNEVDKDWATQLTFYSWMFGVDQFIGAIDQLCCRNQTCERVAQHRALVPKDYQDEILIKLKDLDWRLRTGHFFPRMTLEESQEYFAHLKVQAFGNQDLNDMFAGRD